MLNERSGKGVTPENNAAALLWKVIDPKQYPEAKRQRYFQLLGIPQPSEKGDYFLSLADYLNQTEEIPGLNNSAPRSDLEKKIYDQYEEAQKRPWSKDEFPALADLLAKNGKSLDIIAEAARRPRFYSPLVVSNDEFMDCIDVTFLGVFRDISNQLLLRAMLELKDGRYEPAWRDLECCALLGRLYIQGPFFVDMLVGTAFESKAYEGVIAMASFTDLNMERTRKHMEDMRNLPSPPDIENIFDFGERVCQIGWTYDVASQKSNALKYFGILSDKPTKKYLAKLAADPKMDWDEVMRLSQSEFDRFVSALRKSNYADIHKAMAEIDEETEKTNQILLEENTVKKTMSMSGDPREKAKLFLAIVADNSFVKNTGYIFPLQRREAMSSLARLALALSAYHSDHQTYPATLAELGPKYISEIPKDPFNVEDFKYKTQDGGILLYSVGRNCKDDGGRNYAEEVDFTKPENPNVSEEEKSTDDIAIHMPPIKSGK